MKWTLILIIAAAVVFILLQKPSERITAKDAPEPLQQGLLVSEVANSGEIGSGNPSEAVDIPQKDPGQISAKDAQGHLKKGALVIDVRSSGEFGSGHLPNAVNIPVGELESAVPLQVKDKNQVLLLHCQSGMRSAAGVKKLKAMGYRNVFDLGSLSRAGTIVGGGGAH